MIELYVYSTIMSPENCDVFSAPEKGDFASLMSLFPNFCLRQFCSPLFGLFWLAPGFVEVDEVVK